MSVRWFGSWLMGVLLLVSAARAQDAASSALQGEYAKTAAAAIAEFDAGRFAEARALFMRAHELQPSARSFRTLGMTAFELRMYPRALVELQSALDDTRRPLDDTQRAQVSDLLQQVRAYVGRFRLHVTPADALLQLDGAPVTVTPGEALVLALGDHDFWVRAAGYHELHLPLHVQGREDEDRTITLEPVVVAPAPAPVIAAPVESVKDWRRPLLWTSIGVGAAGVVTAAVFGGLALGRRSSLDDQCPDKTCPRSRDDDRQRAMRFAAASTAGVVVAAVAAAVGTYSLLSERKQRSVSLTPMGVAGRF